VIAGVVVVGGSIAIAQFASAESNGTAACETTQATTLRTGGNRGGHHHGSKPTSPSANDPAPVDETAAPQDPAPQDPGQQDPGQQEPAPQDPAPQDPAPQDPGTPPEDCDEGDGGDDAGNENPAPPPNNGLEVLGRTCENSQLETHDGFQKAPRCVETQMGEVSAAAQNPSLLITRSPLRVRANTAFTLRISTRNLVRDRFLGAAVGGYYLESSFLNAQGLERGHFHVACRMLDSLSRAPDPAPVPAFFKAVEDGQGNATPDSVEVQVTGLPRQGIAQCAAWAGDGSHRAPMMERANQTPAFDAVRIVVTR